MTINQKIIEKKCCFYASDFHLEMTIVPYINKKFEENKNVVIITENKLDETIKILISRMNIKNKEEILNLDWNNNDIKQIDNKNNLVIIINGTEEFVENKNKQINQMANKEEFEVVNCYYFDEVKDRMIEIRAAHTGVLNNLQKDY